VIPDRENHFPKETSDHSRWANQDSLTRLLFIRHHYLNETSPELAKRAETIVKATELLIEEIVTTHSEIITPGSKLQQQVKAVLIKRHPRPGYKLD